MSRKKFNKFGKFGEKNYSSNFDPKTSSGRKKQDEDNKILAANKLKEIELHAKNLSENDCIWIARMRDAVIDDKVLTKKQITLINRLYRDLVPIKVKIETILKTHQDELKKIDGTNKKPSIPVAKGKYYVVWKGRNPGIYTSWEDASKEVTGYSGAKYKKFKSLEEAEKAFGKLSNDYESDKIK